MKTNLIRKVLSSVVVIATVLLGLANTAYAVVSVPPPTTVKVAVPVVMSMDTFNQRTATLPEFSTLKKGDTVVLWDDGRVTDALWNGSFTYYPAGSIVPHKAMYARWKDGVVTLMPTPNTKAGQPPLSTFDALLVQHSTIPMADWQTTLTLVKDGNDSTVWRIPGNAWLLREGADGQLTALVDMFVFESGAAPIPHTNWTTGGILPNTMPKAAGSLPVPISAKPGIH